MNYYILLEPKALIEIQEAFNWYEEQKDSLGYELIIELEACYKLLIDNPERFSYINSTYRRIKTHKFPYILVYEIEGNTIIINSVRHIKQKPL